MKEEFNMKIDTSKIEEHIRGILVALGENPDRDGLKDTPKRVSKMFEEVFRGINYTNEEIACLFSKTFEEDLPDTEIKSGIILMKDIEIFSYCEHHMALMYNMKVAVAYIPNNKVIGFSKVARIADLVGKRLQLQERIGTDIADIIQQITSSEDVAVIIEGEHSCMTARGIKKPGTKSVTTVYRGRFVRDMNINNQLMMMYK